MGNAETTTKFSRLKSISSIDCHWRWFVFKCRLFAFTKENYHPLFRSSPSEVFLGKGVLEIFSKFTGEHPCQSVISKKLLALRRGYFPVNLLHISRTPFPKNTSGGLLLFIVKKMLIETGFKEVCVLKCFLNLFVFGFLFTIIKTKYDLLWWRKCSLKLDYVI